MVRERVTGAGRWPHPFGSNYENGIIVVSAFPHELPPAKNIEQWFDDNEHKFEIRATDKIPYATPVEHF